MASSSAKKKGFVESLREIVTLLLVVFLIRTFGFGLYQVPTGSMETTMLIGERFFADKFSYLFTKPARGNIISFNDPLFQYSDNKVKRLFEEYVWGPANWTKRIIGVPGDTVEGKVEEGKPVIYLNGQKLDQPFVNKFPLITLWKYEQKQMIEMIEQEAMKLVSQKRLEPAMVQRFKEHRLGNMIDLRSYDPAYSYADQPYYIINPHLVVKGPDGMPFLRESGTPMLDPEAKVVPQGKNFWNGTDQFYVELGPTQYWVMGDNRLNSGDSRFFGPLDRKFIHGRIIFRIWSLDSGEDWWILDLLKHPIDFWKRIRWSRFFQIVR